MNPVYDKLLKCYESFRQKIDFQPEVAIVLGSGLGDYADDIRVEAELDYHEIEGFPVSTRARTCRKIHLRLRGKGSRGLHEGKGALL